MSEWTRQATRWLTLWLWCVPTFYLRYGFCCVAGHADEELPSFSASGRGGYIKRCTRCGRIDWQGGAR